MKLVRISSMFAIATALTSSATWAQSSQDALPQSPAHQSAQDNGDVGDIVVTARKRAETLMNVPVAVSVIGASALERASATNLAKIAQLTPQVQIADRTTPNASFLSIRGIGAASQDQGIEQSVLVDIDGIQISRGRITALAMFDLQQVEVLKGPQSLFFGKNSPAGVISVKSKGPGDKLEGYIRAGYEFAANERVVEGAIGGPLSDTFGLRLAARYNHIDGWAKNVAPKGPIANPFDPSLPLPGRGSDRSPRSTEYNARLTAQWKPSSDFDATLRMLGAVTRGNGDGNNIESYCAPGKTILTSYGVSDPNSDCKIDGRISIGGVNPALATLGRGVDHGGGDHVHP
jgi:iron complex outermembrane recepter protein